MWQWSLSLHYPSTISVWAWTKIKSGNESREKENKYIHDLAANLLHIRIGNLDCCQHGHSKNEAGEIDCPCCREMDAMLIALAKIPECEGSISPSSFYRHLLDNSHTF